MSAHTLRVSNHSVPIQREEYAGIPPVSSGFQPDRIVDLDSARDGRGWQSQTQKQCHQICVGSRSDPRGGQDPKQVRERPLPPAHGMPLVNNFGGADDVVVVKTGGRQTGVVGNDAETGAGVEGLGTGSGQSSVLLGQTDKTEAW